MIVAIIKDLFFISKIKESVLQLNKTVNIIKNYDELTNFFDKINFNNKNNDSIKEINNNKTITLNKEKIVNLIIIDLNFNEIKPLETVKKIKNDELLKNKRIIAYCSHVQTDLMNKAKELGIEVMPRSLFTANLKTIIKN